MTYRDWMRGLAMLAIAYVFLVAASLAAFSSGRIVPINSWCKSPDVFKNAIAAFVDGGQDAMHELLVSAQAENMCIRLKDPMHITFEVGEVVARYKEGWEGPEIVISGTLSTGETVYIWRDMADEGLYFGQGT